MTKHQEQTDLLKEIRGSVAELAKRSGITEERAFAAWYAIWFFEIEEEEALEAAGLDGGEDGGLDFFHVDDTNERILILQGHYPSNPEKACPKSKVDTLITAVTAIEKPSSFAKAGRPDIAKAVEEAAQKLKSYEVRLGLVSLGAVSDQILRQVETTNESSRFKPYRFFYDHRKILLEKYETSKEEDDSVPNDAIEFVDDEYFEDKGEYGRAWVGSVNAFELKRLYEKHEDRLFARNVRLFLGTRKGGINEQIVQTAKTDPGKFWALNNGVTIVADSIVEDREAGRFNLTRFSVVNGCQTTVSLARAGAPKGCKVLVRLVAANKAVTTDIVRYNNTQNAVRIWTVRATDPVHVTLRAAFLKIHITYAPKPDNRRFRGKADRVIQIDRLAQFLASRDDRLIEAVKEKSELFDRYYQDIFPHNLSPEDVYLTWRLGVLADDARQERLQLLRETDAADKEQTALLGVAGTYWILHCANRLLETLNVRPHHFDLKAINSEPFSAALRKYVQEAIDIYMELAIDTYNSDEYTSVRQALRSPKFLSKIDLKLPHRFARLKSKKKLPLLEATAKSLTVK